MLARTTWEQLQSTIHHHSLGYTIMTLTAALPLFPNPSLNPRHAYEKVQVTLPPRPIQVEPERVYR